MKKLKKIIKTNKKKIATGLILLTTTAALNFGDIKYTAYNTLDKITNKIIEETFSIKKNSTKKNIANPLAKTFSQYLQAQNIAHLKEKGINYHLNNFIAKAKYKEFSKMCKKEGISLNKVTTDRSLNEFWEKQGFVYVGELRRDFENRIVENAVFGEMYKKINMIYNLRGEKIEYEAIIFEPIVDFWETEAGISWKCAFTAHKKVYLDTKCSNFQGEKFIEYYKNILAKRNKKEMNFEEKLALEAYLELEEMSKKSGRSFKEEFNDMMFRALLKIHEPEHFYESDNEDIPSLMIIACAEKKAEQSFFLSNYSLMLTPSFLSEDLKNEFLNSNFYGRKKIAKRILKDYYNIKINDAACY